MDDLLAVISNREALEEVIKESERKVYFAKFDGYNIRECAFVSGLPDFDPAVHKSAQLRHAVELNFTPLSSSKYQDPYAIRLIAETREWLNITLASITALGFESLAPLVETYWKYEQVESGRMYKAKDQLGEYTGEMKPATAPRILAIYKTEQEAMDQADAIYGGGNGDNTQYQASQATQPANNDAARKQTAYNFLRYYVTQAKGDLIRVAEAIEANSILKEFYGEQGINHPDVVALLGETAEPEKPF